mmetsp:Transcript_2448/g.5666  ORF Transcript_2448/g.5666 Transcript_2448/m.5666 type:complete len:447 (+) Transcript_2448:56-1396(+)|eukprot:CAMPEP_0172389246 /NCGR_PEP_ID=MMETSP1061-20121228/6189_1 /TAXON_ID=37318 /ORGANISM="Pseudo-nitzschia pungens, Strain cf. pungens" /LENGTH=446 /DNA_ID=CAMNT_0013119359 /DNA_START=185 /DNA_END=1525 /DNA_ORIENTATION=+
MSDDEPHELDDLIKRLMSLKDERPGTLAEMEEDEIHSLCSKVREVFLSEPMLLRPEAPIKICGDLHGQFFDLLRIIDHNGQPPNTNYMFLGDYCDRGKQSIEILCLLFAFKVKYPSKIHLLRGNHETAKVSRMYGFHDECKSRFSVDLWKAFCDIFNCMPVAAIISDKIFCCHGGLSPELESLDQIDAIERPVDVPEEGLLCDLMWADPEPGMDGYDVNDRGTSYIFGEDVVDEFLKKHDLDVVVRAHQVVEEGYEFFADQKLVTMFSAPNYTGEYTNCGATMIVDANLTCRFQLLKPCTKSQRPKKEKETGVKLTPFQLLQKNSRKVKNALTVIRCLGGMTAEEYRKKLEATKICRDSAVDNRSLNRSRRASVTEKSETMQLVTESGSIRFHHNSLILETEDLTRRETSWGDIWEDLFYDADQLAEFRHAAFVEECEAAEEEDYY